MKVKEVAGVAAEGEVSGRQAWCVAGSNRAVCVQCRWRGSEARVVARPPGSAEVKRRWRVCAEVQCGSGGRQQAGGAAAGWRLRVCR